MEIAALLERLTGRNGVFPTAIAPLCLYRSSTPTEPIPALYQPALCVVAQGRKQVLLGDERYVYDPDSYLLTSIDLPLFGQVMEATPETPYLAFSLDLDPAQIGALALETRLPADSPAASPRGLGVSPIDAPLRDALGRLLCLLDTPEDIPVMAPLLLREIFFRLLRAEQGERLGRIALDSTHARRVAAAVHWLKHNFDQPLHIEEIARAAHMSPSGLHHHFKAVTTLSPLQYQKQLRLQEARRLMLTGLEAAEAGYQVGYQSASQFSREYRRLFGAPPQRDIARLHSDRLHSDRLHSDRLHSDRLHSDRLHSDQGTNPD